jgi:hypothetical protein
MLHGWYVIIADRLPPNAADGMLIGEPGRVARASPESSGPAITACGVDGLCMSIQAPTKLNPQFLIPINLASFFFFFGEHPSLGPRDSSPQVHARLNSQLRQNVQERTHACRGLHVPIESVSRIEVTLSAIPSGEPYFRSPQ